MLKQFSDYVISTLLKQEGASRAGAALDLFLYDTLKIFLLLKMIVFVVAVIRAYFPPERTKKIFFHEREYIGNVMTALIGIVTPFCLFSTVSLFIGLAEAGVPLGASMYRGNNSSDNCTKRR